MNFIANLFFSTKKDLEKFCKLIVQSFDNQDYEAKFAKDLKEMREIAQRLEKSELSKDELWVIPNQLSRMQYSINKNFTPGFRHYDSWAKKVFGVLPKNVERQIIEMCLEDEHSYLWLELIDTLEARKAHATITTRMQEEVERYAETQRIKQIFEARSVWGENWTAILDSIKKLEITPVAAATAFIEGILDGYYHRKDQVDIEEPRKDRVVSAISNQGSGYKTAHLIPDEDDLLLAINFSAAIPQLVQTAKIVSTPVSHLKAHHYWEQYMGADAPAGTNTIFIFRVDDHQYLCWDFGYPI